MQTQEKYYVNIKNNEVDLSMCVTGYLKYAEKQKYRILHIKKIANK